MWKFVEVLLVRAIFVEVIFVGIVFVEVLFLGIVFISSTISLHITTKSLILLAY